MRLTELATSRRDVFNIERSRLIIRDGFNARLDQFPADDEDRAFIDSIKENGVLDPLTGHKDNHDQFIITKGHRRKCGADCAAAELKEEIKAAKGEGDKARVAELKAKLERLSTLPVMSEVQGYSDKDRHFDTLIGNTGKPLDLLETAFQFERLMKDFQSSEEEIRRRTGRSKPDFANCLLLLGAKETHPFIRAKQISPSLAVELARKLKDPEERVRVIEEGIRAASANGKTHVTAKNLNASVRASVAPPRASAAAATSSPSSSSPSSSGTGFTLHATTQAPAAKAERRAFNPGDLRTERNINLSSMSAKLEGVICLARHKTNDSFFYQLDATAGKKKHLSPWRYAQVSSHRMTAEDCALGFDTSDACEAAALTELYLFLEAEGGINPAEELQRVMGNLQQKARILRGEDAGAGSAGVPPAGSGILPELDPTAPPPAPDHDDEDSAPTDDTEALEHFRRVHADLTATGGIKERNERWATYRFILAYLDGEHTHNQLRAFVLYGSPETRALTKRAKK